LARRKRHLLLLDLTSDIGIPTVAALGMTAMGERLGVGFATRANLKASVHAAMTELMQMELRVMAAQFAHSPDTNLKRWFQEVRFEGIVPFKENPIDETPTGAGSDINLDGCIERLKAAGCRVAIMNFTRPEFAVPVVRAISPDLCHWKPRLGRARLMAREENGRLGSVPKNELDLRLLRI
jgi:ribosomal protein S12 methylthiotransferase accessory factor